MKRPHSGARNLEEIWNDPGFVRFMRRLASFAEVLLFDKRGVGLSDPLSLVDLPTLESWTEDVAAVMDAAGWHVSIFKRRDGRWAAALNVGWRDGKRHRKYFYGATRDEVQKELTTALRAQQQGLPVAPERRRRPSGRAVYFRRAHHPQGDPRRSGSRRARHVDAATGRCRPRGCAGRGFENR